MKKKPSINVQLIHIEGPFKGQIQEFSDSEIIIGRHPSCHVQFPVDYNTISRKHGKIVRDGNRFKFIDHSTNGTYLNGKRTTEALLKDGDVLIFSKGGPKISFLTQVVDTPTTIESEQDASASAPEPVVEKEMVILSEKTEKPVIKEKTEQRSIPEEASKDIQQPQRVKMAISIVFGPKLQSFNELPIIIGKGADCHFVLDHPHVFDHHITIFYHESQYWVKDLTGKNIVLVNGKPVDLQMPMMPDCILSLTPKGPAFKFLGQGHLIEIEAPLVSKNGEGPETRESPDKKTSVSAKPSLIKKFWRR